MKYGIIVDSGCDLKELEGNAKGWIDFTRAPLKLDIGDKEYIDDVTLDTKSFMEEMHAFKGRTGSAAPSSDAWYQAIDKSDAIFIVTVTGALSGSYSSAKIAVDMYLEEHKDKRIHLIDSKSASSEMTLIVRKLTELIEQGLEFDEIVAAIERYRTHTELLFVLENLDNLVKNGRISKVQGSIAGLLGIKIVGYASEEGTLEVSHKCRGRKTAYDKAVEEMIARGYAGGDVIITHCFNQESAEYLKEQIRNKYPNSHVTLMETSGLCSYYAEQNGMLIGYVAGEC